MIRRLFLPRRKFTTDHVEHRVNIRELEDWSDEVRRSLPVSGGHTADVTTPETRTTATFGDLATVGPSVVVKTGQSGTVLIVCSARVQAGAGGQAGMACQVLDDTATEVHAPAIDDMASSDGTTSYPTVTRLTFLHFAGNTEHTFNSKYIGNGANPSTFKERRLIVIPL